MLLAAFGLTIGILVIYLYCEHRSNGRRLQVHESLPIDLAQRMMVKFQQMRRLSDRMATGLTVRDIMTAPPDPTLENQSVRQIRKTMKALCVHHAVVQDERGHLVGIISDRDLALRRGSKARHVMTPDPVSVEPECSPKRAVSLMISKRISCLPVVKNFRVCGLITRTDLLLTLEALLEIRQQAQHEDQVSIETGNHARGECGTRNSESAASCV